MFANANRITNSKAKPSWSSLARKRVIRMLSEFLDQFRKGIAAIDLSGEDPDFDENAKVVGDWLDANFEYSAYDCDSFAKYFQKVRERWPFITCRKSEGYCPACNEHSERLNKVIRRTSLYGLRLMIETNLSKLDEIETGFDSVFE